MGKIVIQRRILLGCVAALVLAVAATGVAQRRSYRGTRDQALPLANSEDEKRILSVIEELQRSGGTYLSVDANDGRMLRVLTEAANARNVVEIGTSTGYSGLWLSLALKKTGGRLTTFEVDRSRAARARENFNKAGVGDLVTIIEGDAHQNVSRLKEPIDVAFIDADKEGYPDYLARLLPLVRPGGLILAHNVNSSRDYNGAILSNPALETLFYMEGGGLGITLKKR